MDNYKEPDPQGFTEDQIKRVNIFKTFRDQRLGLKTKIVKVSTNRKGVSYVHCERINVQENKERYFSYYIDTDEQGKPFIYVYNNEKMYL